MRAQLAGPLAAVAAVLLLVGCTGGSGARPAPAVTSTGLSSSSGDGPQLAGGDGESPPARSTIITTPTPSLSRSAGATEVDGTCPYISNAAFQLAEGDLVGRVTVIKANPVGCRFYFANDETQIIGEVLVQQFADEVSAYNAMVGSSRGHPEVQSSTTIGDGAVLFRMPLQGEATWQCVLASGRRVFTVRTRQTNTSQDAANLGRAVAANVVK
jgi:hypothetical protein